MPCNGMNIYAAARKTAGLTQECAAPMIGVSVRCLADYEIDQRIPPNDVVERMVDVYETQYLAYQYLRAINDSARRIIPDIEELRLPEAVLTLVDAIYQFADDKLDRELISIAKDGIIDETERPRFDAILQKIEGIIRAAMAVTAPANQAHST